MSDPKDNPRGFASPPCLAHEIDPAYADILPAGPQPLTPPEQEIIDQTGIAEPNPDD
ncbi:hypothetical protein [Maricaulis sp.]|uniref:hypothetical protein n=1 Tax=Maricaulis sp. TaxID=1486257 RepID=UPI003A8F456B